MHEASTARSKSCLFFLQNCPHGRPTLRHLCALEVKPVTGSPEAHPSEANQQTEPPAEGSEM